MKQYDLNFPLTKNARKDRKRVLLVKNSGEFFLQASYKNSKIKSKKREKK
jgi:hypothetical protein